MNTLHHILKIALLYGSAIFLSSALSFAQEDVIELLEGSDNIRIDGKTGNYIITGNVVFKKENSKLYCDSAYYNLVRQDIKAYSHVHLNKEDTLNMFCDSLFFDTKKDFAKLWGNVRVRDNEYKLTTDSLDYDTKRNQGVYKNGGVITSISNNDRLTSKVGYFYPESKNFNFRGDVIYTSKEYQVYTDTLRFNGRSKKAYFYGPTDIVSEKGKMYCETGWYDASNEKGVLQKNAYIDQKDTYISGDSLYYSALDSMYVGRGNVVIRDTSNNIEFNGDYAISEEKKKYALITGHALAKRYDNKDTLFIHADTLYNHLDSIGDSELILAYYDVKLFRADMQGVCDSMSYDRVGGVMNMYYEPALWAKEAQLTGDTVSVYEKKGEIQRAFLRKQGLVVTHVDSTDYYNQVNGTTMNAYFDSTEIRRVDIEGNAKTIYFLEDEEENDTVIVVNRKGMNRIYSSNISLYFEKGDISTATYRDSPEGVLYPMNQIKKSEERVQEFKWDESRRPISWETMILDDGEFLDIKLIDYREINLKVDENKAKKPSETKKESKEEPSESKDTDSE
ncbi:MAG: OstA-like protein [Brumimicrobium sp.]